MVIISYIKHNNLNKPHPKKQNRQHKPLGCPSIPVLPFVYGLYLKIVKQPVGMENLGMPLFMDPPILIHNFFNISQQRLALR